MGFDARYVSPLDYDFTGIGLDIKGVSDDPTDDQVWEFQLEMSKVAEILGQDFAPDDQEAMLEFMKNLSREDFARVRSHVIEALTKMLNDKPTVSELEQISKKSYRHFQAYQGSVMADVMDPKTVKKLTSRD